MFSYFSVIHNTVFISFSNTMTQSNTFETLVNDFSDTDLIDHDDSAVLVCNDPSSITNQRKRHKIAVRNLIIYATIIITIVISVSLIFFLTRKQYSTSLTTQYTTSFSSCNYLTFWQNFYSNCDQTSTFQKWTYKLSVYSWHLHITADETKN